MKKSLPVIIYLLIFSTTRLLAQLYGNEWIPDYNQQYYKIQVAADGIYRIPYATLNSVVPNFSSLSPGSFELFHNGQQVPIYLSSTGTFGPNDYIEFYGRKNIGDVDSNLYANDSMQPHIYYSLFTDTSVYYLVSIANGHHLLITEVSNNLSNPPPAESYFMYASRQIYTGQNIQGMAYYAGGDQAFKATFDYGEGYGNSTFFGGVASNGNPPQVTSQSFSIPTPAVYPGGPAATFKTVFENYADDPGESHFVNVQLNGLPPITESTTTNNPFYLARINQPLSINELPGGASNVTFSTQDNSQSFQQNVVFLNEIDYPRMFDFGGVNSFSLTINGNQSGSQLLSISNFNSNGLQPVLFDLSNSLLIKSTQAPGASPLQYVLPASTTPTRDLCLISTDPSSYNTITQMAPTVFKNYANLNADYLIIYNTRLDSNGDVTNYLRYRSNNGNPYLGKFFDALVDIDQLYDQFAYGVKKSPLAIRNFIQYAINRYNTGAWIHKPQYVFLMGKAREYPDIRNGGTAYTQCLVPTFGEPGGDNLLAATRASDTTTVAIGRLAAQTTQEVQLYLAKMQAYESYQDTASTGNGSATGYPADESIAGKLWQKQVLHFTGGTGVAQQTLYQFYLEVDSSIAGDTSWGANITSFQKTSSAPIATSEAQVIENRIDSGVSLLTFFGHSSAGAFDFSIDEPENYTNISRYPVILSNGCFSGDIHEATPGYSERFVLEANKGAIAFMATTGLSVDQSLANFSQALYQNFSRPYYMNSYGNCVRQTLKNIYTNSPGPFDLMACYDFTLHGDPALRLNQYERPDYAIDNSSVYFTPSTVTQSNNTFQINIICTNLGKAIKDSMNVSLKRVTYDVNNNQVIFNYVQRVKAPYYKDTITFTLPTLISGAGTGQNLFYPYVDAGFEIAEMAENNNGLTVPKPLFIQQDDVLPIYPYDFAIDSSANVILKASTTNPFAALRKYDFQIDTTRLFNSPVMQTGYVTQTGGVLHWSPSNLVNKDSVVYYWRVKIDTSLNNWHYTSFEHIKGQYGWDQSHFFQFSQDNFQTLILDSPSRTFKFDPTVNNITVLTGYANAEGGNLDYETMGWNYNNSNEYRFRMGGCGFNAGVTFAVIDGNTGLPWVSYNTGGNFGNVYGNWHCSNQADPQYGFDFSTTGNSPLGPLWSTLIQTFIDSIPVGDYVLIYSDNRVPYSQWSQALVSAFAQLGFNAQQLTTSSTPGPFVFFTKRTANNSYASTFVTTNSFNTPVSANIPFNGTWYQGQMLSPLIGPAKGWNDMQWRRAAPLLAGAVDTIDILGVNYSGQPTLLRSTAANDNPITSISAVTYPYLQLRWRTLNNVNHKPAQLNYWRVLYQQVPEAAMNPSAYFSITSDTVSQGSTLNVGVGLENVTNIKMDSMLTYYTITDAQSHTTVDSVTFAPLPGLSVLNLKYNKPVTSGSAIGLDHLTIEANPHNKQPEQYHFNNYAQLNFYGQGNTTNPLLDVTFDGVHIFNGDIISAKPEIVISLRSLSKYLALNDSTSLNVFVLYPGQATPVRVNYDGQILKFVPANPSTLTTINQAEALFNPNFTQDGTYEIMVQDMDASGNHSSNVNRYEGNTFFDYKMTFQVINKPSITNVLNYPNPFSTATKFVFTLTGSELPQSMTIQIMTVKGIVVKEITEQELGALHIGTNISEYAWDGRDQYGSLLANGVYFYRVITRLDNKNMDGMSTSYDKYFKKGYGKLVILR